MVTMIVQLLIPTVISLLAQVKCNPYDSNSIKINNQYPKGQNANITDNDSSPIIMIVQGYSDIQIMWDDKGIDLMNNRRVLNYKPVCVQAEQPNLGVPSPINNGPIGPDTTFVPLNHEEITTVVPINIKNETTDISLPEETKVKPGNESESNTEINKIIPDTINNGPDTIFDSPNHEEITDNSPNHEEITDKKHQIDATDANITYNLLVKPENVDVDEGITHFPNKERNLSKMKNTSQVLVPTLQSVLNLLKTIIESL